MADFETPDDIAAFAVVVVEGEAQILSAQIFQERLSLPDSHLDPRSTEIYALRKATPEDAQGLAALDAQCHPHPWSAQAFASEQRTWLIEPMVAYVVTWRVLDELQIQNVTTAPDHRRKGFARALLQHVLKEPGLRTATLELRAGNDAALALYRSLGFQVVGRRPRYYSTGEDAVLMSCALA